VSSNAKELKKGGKFMWDAREIEGFSEKP